MRQFLTPLLLGASLVWAAVAAAQPLPDDLFNQVTADIRKNAAHDYDQVQRYTKLLNNPDLTDTQRASVLMSRANTRAIVGDDKIGGTEDYARIVNEFPDSKHAEQATKQYKYTYGQMYHMTKRALEAGSITEQVVSDLWGLGYWENATELAKQRNAPLGSNSPLLQDMQAAGYLCEVPITATGRFSYNLNGMVTKLDFCPEGRAPKYSSPRKADITTFGNTISELHNLAELRMAQLAEVE